MSSTPSTASREPARSPFRVAGPRAISDREFGLFRAYIEAHWGIHLSDVKRPLLTGRLARRLRELDLESFDSYYEHLLANEATESLVLINAVSTNETHFFREPRHFGFLRHTVFPQWEARRAADPSRRVVRVWSAACSTGEEPYTLAMELLSALPPERGWDIEIEATDISTQVLGKAKEGIYDLKKAKEIPPEQLNRFMLKGSGSQQGRMRAGDEIRRVIRFSACNLTAPPYPVAGRFDLIFCRNVLMYFSRETRESAVTSLLARLEPDGYFFLGHAESLVNMKANLHCVTPTVYQPGVGAR